MSVTTDDTTTPTAVSVVTVDFNEKQPTNCISLCRTALLQFGVLNDQPEAVYKPEIESVSVTPYGSSTSTAVSVVTAW